MFLFYPSMQKMAIFTMLLGIVFGASDILNIDQGQLIGSSLTSRYGREFKAFQGIPYAKPSVGDLRFKDPVAADSWKGVLNATVEPQACMQKNLFYYKQANVLVGSEDCLYLNVNVLDFWWSFIAGSGGISSYGPQYLLDKDIVLVTINYRLGILGFLSTEDDVLPGNYGMKDQVLALKWVEQNIDKFGGDQIKVTIFGTSAGGVSVGLHLLSPMSKGLFHKAIIETATPLNIWAVCPPGWTKRRAFSISTISGCPTEPRKMVKCLRDLPAKVLVDVYNDLFEWRTFPIINFQPVAENCKNKESAFLCKYPLLDFKVESNVTVLMGMNDAEGGIFAAGMYNAIDLVYTELKENYNHYMSSLMEYRYTTKYSDNLFIGRKTFERYFPGGTLESPLDAVRLFTGGLFIHGVFYVAIKLSPPVYYYVYNHTNYVSYNALYGPYPNPKKLGATHADEITSLFFIDGMGDLKGEDLEVSKLMVNIWTKFATVDELTVDGTEKGRKWPKFDAKNQEFVLINSSNPVVSKTMYYADKFKFWNNLPLLSGLKKSDRAATTNEL